MKKRFFCIILISLTLILALCAVGCNEDNEANTPSADSGKVLTLNVYNWGEYISDGSFGELDTNKEFEKYCLEELGLRVVVNYSTYATNEDMYSKIKNGAVSYDIVIPSDYMIQKMIEENLLLSFNVKEEIENFANIDENFVNPYYDPENVYSVPYTYGMLGIIYNTDLVDPEDVADESWGLLWNEKYKGKILQFNNPRDAFASAMYYKGIDVNSTNPDDWNMALEILKKQKPLVQGYVNDEIFNKMSTASAAIAPYFAGDFITMAETNPSLALYYPKEGVNYFVDAMCIPANSKNPELAKEYINFMLTQTAAVANAKYIGYASPNKLVASKQEVDGGFEYTYDEEYLDYMGEETLEILYGVDPKEINSDYEAKINGTACYKSFSPEIQEHVNTLWESLKTENSTELWVHILSIGIVLAVISLGVYSSYIKKTRSKHYRLRDKEKRLAAKKSANKK